MSYNNMSYNNMSDICRNHYPFFHEECGPCNFDQEVAYHQNPPADYQYSSDSYDPGVPSFTESGHNDPARPFTGQVSYFGGNSPIRQPEPWTPNPFKAQIPSLGDFNPSHRSPYPMASKTHVDLNEPSDAASGHDASSQARFGSPVPSSRGSGPSTSNTAVNLNESSPGPSTVPAQRVDATSEPANIANEAAAPSLVAAKTDDTVHTSPPTCNLNVKHTGDIARVHVTGLFKAQKTPGFKTSEVAQWLCKEIMRKSSDDLRTEAMYITNNKDQILDEIKQLAYDEAKKAVDIAFEKTTTILKSQKYMSHWTDFLRHLPETDARRSAMRKLVHAKYAERRRLIQLEGNIPQPFPACQTNPSLHDCEHASFVSQKKMSPADAVTPGAHPPTARKAIQRAMLNAECGSNRDACRRALRTVAWYMSAEDKEEEYDSGYQDDHFDVVDSESNDSEDNGDDILARSRRRRNREVTATIPIDDCDDGGTDDSQMDDSQVDDSEMDDSEMDDSEMDDSENDSEDIEDSELSGYERREINEDDKAKSDRFLTGFMASRMARQYRRGAHILSENEAPESDQEIEARVANKTMDQGMRLRENEDCLVAELKELKDQASRYLETQARLVAEFQRQESKHRENEARLAAELKASESKLSNVEGRLTDPDYKEAALRTSTTAAKEMINETTPNERVIYTRQGKLAKLQVQATQITREVSAAKKQCSDDRNQQALDKAVFDYQVKAKQINRKYHAVQGTGITEDKLFEIREAMEEKRRENNRQVVVAEQEARREKERELMLAQRQSRLKRLRHPSEFRVLGEAAVSSAPWASRPSFTQARERDAIERESHRISMSAQREQIVSMQNLSYKAPEPVVNSTLSSIAVPSAASQKPLWSMPEATFISLKADHERSVAKGEKDVAIIRERMEREARLVGNKKFAHAMELDVYRTMSRGSFATTMSSTRSKSPESTASISSSAAERSTSPNQRPTGADSDSGKFIRVFDPWRKIDDDIENLKLQKHREMLTSATRADNLRNFKNFSEVFKLNTPVPEGLLTKPTTPKEPQTPKESLLSTFKTEAAKEPTSASSSCWQRGLGKPVNEARAQWEVKDRIGHDNNTLSVPRRPLRAVPMVDDDVSDSWSTKSDAGGEKDVQERSNTQSVATYAQGSDLPTYVVGDGTKEDEEIAETEEEDVIRVEKTLAKLKDSIAEMKAVLAKQEIEEATKAEENATEQQDAVKEDVVEKADPVVAQKNETIAETVEGPDADKQDDSDCCEAATEYSWSEASDISETSESIDWEMVDKSD